MPDVDNLIDNLSKTFFSAVLWNCLVNSFATALLLSVEQSSTKYMYFATLTDSSFDTESFKNFSL